MNSLMKSAAALALLCLAALPAIPAASSTLHDAARRGDVSALEAMLDAGADIDEREKTANASTPLIQAAMNGHLDAVRLLCERGASVTAKDKYDWTALSAAAYKGRYQVGRFLMENGAEMESARALFGRIAGDEPRQAERLLDRLAAEMKREEESRADRRQGASGTSSGGMSKEELEGMLETAAQRAADKASRAAAEKAAPEKPAAPYSDADEPPHKLPERPDDFAVVVGIEKYSDLPEAQFGRRDAEAVKNHLIALGYPSRNVVLLSGEKAVRSSLEKFIEAWLPRNAKAASRVFFYFSGHGAPDAESGRAYLVPWDGDPGFLENTAYPLDRLYQKLGALKAREIVVVLDSCFSGAGGRSVLAKGARPLVTKIQSTAVPADRMTVLAAASEDQITSTREDQGHGTFTYHFLKGLGGGARTQSGDVTARSLYEYLKPKVQDDARRQNRDQTPVLEGGDRVLFRLP